MLGTSERLSCREGIALSLPTVAEAGVELAAADVAGLEPDAAEEGAEAVLILPIRLASSTMRMVGID